MTRKEHAAAVTDVDDAIARLLHAPPAKRQGCYRQLARSIHEEPSLATRLPPIETVPAGGGRDLVAGLHFLAIRERRDVAAAYEHLLELQRLEMSTASMLLDLGNGGAGMGAFAPLVLQFLGHPSPALRWRSAYYLSRVGLSGPLDLTEWAHAILHSIVDGGRGGGSTKGSVASLTRPVLQRIAVTTTDREDWITNARRVDAELEPPQRKTFRAQLKALFPAAHEAATGRASVKPSPIMTELLAGVYADLADDAPRLVYADSLLQAGDVRGEFIILQCERHRTRGQLTLREIELAEAYSEAWVGALGKWLSPGLIYERGFLHRCAHGGGDERLSSSVVGSPIWSTLEYLDMWDAYRDADRNEVAFLSSPVLAGLRELVGITLGELVGFGGRSLEHLVMISEERISWPTLVACVAKQPNLVRLQLAKETGNSVLAALHAQVPSLRTISLPERELVRDGAGWEVAAHPEHREPRWRAGRVH